MIAPTRVLPFIGETVSVTKTDGSSALIHHLEGALMYDNEHRRRGVESIVNRVDGGAVLLFGLGLGLTLGGLIARPDVTHITVVEINKEILDRVSPFYTEEKVRYVHADCTKWTPDREFDWLVDMTGADNIKRIGKQK